MRSVFFKILRIALLLAMAALVWAGYYLNTKGFSRSWRDRVTAEFRKHGVEVELRRLTLDPFRGLGASDVRIYQLGGGVRNGEPAAEISRVGLDINFANLLQGKPFLNAIDLRNTRLALAIDPDSGDDARLVVDGLKARILFPPQQIRVSQFECNLYGLTVAATGTLIVPEGYNAQLGENSNDRWSWVRTLTGQMEKLDFPGQQPRLDLEFTGDISKLEEMRVEKASLQSGPINWNQLKLDGLAAKLTYQQRVLRLDECVIRDRRGTLFASGDFNPETGKGRFQIRSGIDPQPIFTKIAGRGLASEITFFSEPLIEAYGKIDLNADPKFQLIGRAALDRFGVRSVIFQGFSADYAWDGTRLLVRNIQLNHRSGQLSGQFHRDAGGVKLRLESTLDPRALAPLLDRKAGDMLAEWEFQSPPRVDFSGTGPGPGLNDIRGSGNLSVGRASYRGVGVDSGSAQIVVGDRAVTYKNIDVRRPEGSGRGAFTYDFGKGEARIDNVRTTMTPVLVAAWIHPNLVRDVTPYRFNGPPDVQLSGVVKLRGAAGTRLDVNAIAPRGLSYTFLGKDLPIVRGSGRLLFEDGRLKLRQMQGSLFGGDIAAEADISLDRTKPGYTSTINVRDLDFESLTGLYFNYKDSQGKLSGNYAFGGAGKDARTMTGAGQIEVTDGNVFAIPVLGPLSTILNGIVPGMGYTRARRATATFTVKDGVINSGDFNVIGQGFSLIGGGDIFFLDDRLRFDTRINAQGLPGILLFPVSKLFEYTARGTLKEPGWRPKLLSP